MCMHMWLVQVCLRERENDMRETYRATLCCCFFRLAVQCAWIVLKTWSSSVDMAHVNFVGIAWMSVPSAGSLWRNESFSTKKSSCTRKAMEYFSNWTFVCRMRVIHKGANQPCALQSVSLCWNIYILESLCSSVCVSGFCPDSIFGTAQPFLTKLGMVMHHHEPECHAERLVC